MRIAITGATGAIGREVVAVARSAGNATVLAPPSDELDLVDVEKATNWVVAVSPDIVIHLSGSCPPASSERMYASNVGTTFSMLEALLHVSRKIPLVLASTAAVYGRQPPDVPIAESARTRPVGAYGASKLAAESLARTYCESHEMTVAVARIFNVVGSPRDSNSMVPQVAARLRAAAPGASVAIRDPESIRDFVHVTDVASALLQIAATAPDGFSVYNIGSGEGVSVLEAARLVAKMVGSSAQPVPGEISQSSVEWSVADADALRSLGWRPKHGLSEAIRSAIELG